MKHSPLIFMAVISAIVVVIIFVVVYRKKLGIEKYHACVCSSREGRQRDCQDVAEVNNLYVTNQLTEYTPLESPGWSKVSPGDIDFPPSEGCGWSDKDETEKKWGFWDFSDFGG